MFSCSVFISSNHDPSSTAPAKTTIASQDQSEETKTYKIHRNLHSHNFTSTTTIITIINIHHSSAQSYTKLSSTVPQKIQIERSLYISYILHCFLLFVFRQSGEVICYCVLGWCLVFSWDLYCFLFPLYLIAALVSPVSPEISESL